MNGLRLLLIGYITAASILSVLFAFMTWIRIDTCDEGVGDFGICEPLKLYGPDVDLIAPFGDGLLVAALGLAAFLLRIAMLFMRRAVQVLLSAIAAAGLAIMGIAGYAAFYDWDGDRQFALYGEVFLGATLAVAATWLLSLPPRQRPDELTEAMESWA